MRRPTHPEIGGWFTDVDGSLFEVVATDADRATIEVQYFDGAVEEFDFDTWEAMELRHAEPPDDWSGALELDRDDYGVDLDNPMEAEPMNVLDVIDRDY
ncbi:MAG: hypothetical protein KDG50_13665 [Chromatiales bacterium]|nr:hypothetical protein [Chromatiales bacterium]